MSRDDMALNVYFSGDIQAVLESAILNGGSPPNLSQLVRECGDVDRLAAMIDAYQQGYIDAIIKVGIAFGISLKGENL